MNLYTCTVLCSTTAVAVLLYDCIRKWQSNKQQATIASSSIGCGHGAIASIEGDERWLMHNHRRWSPAAWLSTATIENASIMAAVATAPPPAPASSKDQHLSIIKILSQIAYPLLPRYAAWLLVTDFTVARPVYDSYRVAGIMAVLRGIQLPSHKYQCSSFTSCGKLRTAPDRSIACSTDSTDRSFKNLISISCQVVQVVSLFIHSLWYRTMLGEPSGPRGSVKRAQARLSQVFVCV